ncbi:pilus assembly protein [Thalassotalea fonticola]|uniref:Pilus assembly protein n=1 Tax=Thalassotalea fonticola TaxID=3065649 RepID=A0ABZ0GTW7_9GAMM|nr:pilus assembly protein [Colwelliaceae bacterium S1-1]
MKQLKKHQGMYTVEFAIVGSLFFLIFFAALEISRLLFTWNILTEVSRRGARLATVCNLLSDTSDLTSITEPLGVTNLASFGNISMIPNLTADNLNITYLDIDGVPATAIHEIRLVRAEIIDYQHELIIPGLFLTLNSPTFSTTLVSESLGAIPGVGYTTCI